MVVIGEAILLIRINDDLTLYISKLRLPSAIESADLYDSTATAPKLEEVYYLDDLQRALLTIFY